MLWLSRPHCTTPYEHAIFLSALTTEEAMKRTESTHQFDHANLVLNVVTLGFVLVLIVLSMVNLHRRYTKVDTT